MVHDRSVSSWCKRLNVLADNEPDFYIPQTILGYAQISEETAPNGDWGRYWVRFMYEIGPSSHLQSHEFLQQRNNGSSMRRRRCWISQTSRPMLFLPSNHVWEASTPWSNTTKCASIKPLAIMPDLSILGMQRRRRKPRRPYPMAYKAEGQRYCNQHR